MWIGLMTMGDQTHMRVRAKSKPLLQSWTKMYAYILKKPYTIKILQYQVVITNALVYLSGFIFPWCNPPWSRGWHSFYINILGWCNKGSPTRIVFKKYVFYLYMLVVLLVLNVILFGNVKHGKKVGNQIGNNGRQYESHVQSNM